MTRLARATGALLIAVIAGLAVGAFCALAVDAVARLVSHLA